MPTYEYSCGRCHHRFDIRQGFHDEPSATCPKCQGAARRVFQAVPIVFKGSGFYCTDHGKSGMVGSAKSQDSEDKKEKVEAVPAASKVETTPTASKEVKTGAGDSK